MDPERQEKLLPHLWPGRDPKHIALKCETLISEQLEDYKRRKKLREAGQRDMLQAALVPKGCYKGLHPVLADRLGEPNKSDHELTSVLRLLGIEEQIEVIERLNIGETLDHIYEWALERIKGDAA